MLLALVVAAAAASTALVTLGSLASLATFAAWASGTAPAEALLFALAAAILITLVSVVLLELVGTTRFTRGAKVLVLALSAATLIILIAVALLELVESAWSSRTTLAVESLVLALAAATLIILLAVALLELVGTAGTTRSAEALLLALAATSLVALVAVALLELVGAALVAFAKAPWRALVVVAVVPISEFGVAGALVLFLAALVLLPNDLVDGGHGAFVVIPVAILITIVIFAAAVAELLVVSIEVVLLLEGFGILFGDRRHAFGARAPSPRHVALVGLLELRLRSEVFRVVGKFLRPVIWPVVLRKAGRVDLDAPVGTVIVEAAALPVIDLVDLLHVDRPVDDLHHAVARHAVVVNDALTINRPVDIGCGEERHAKASNRHGIVGDCARGHVARLHEHPGLGDRRVVSDRHAIGVARPAWPDGRPADIVVAIAPQHPRRRPGIARHPEPAVVLIVAPAAVVIDRPGEGLVGIPVPAVLVGVGPTPDGVGTPIGRDILWQPHIAKARMPHPLPVWRQLVIEGVDVDGVLRRRGPGKAEPVGSRQRHARRREERGED